MSLLRWYNPLVLRLALFAAAIAISVATGGSVTLADGDDWGGP